MKYLSLILVSFSWIYLPKACFGQESSQGLFNTPSLAFKTNILYDLTIPFNLGIEIKTGTQYTVDISMNYNPMAFKTGISFKNFILQPELRYWTCEPFNGHFFAAHAIYGQFNTHGVILPFANREKQKDKYYQGDLYGAGLGYGYQWYLSPRWNLEAMLGMGYLYIDYSKYECSSCGKKLHKKNKHFVGPTKAAISLVYILK